MSRGETEREESVQHHDTQAAPLTYVPWSRYGRKYRNVSLSLRLNLSGSDCSYTPLTFWLICACGCVQISWNELVKDEFRMMVDECMIYSVTSSVRWGCKVEGSAVLEDATENETSLKRFVETDCWFTARSVSHFTQLNRIHDADYWKVLCAHLSSEGRQADSTCLTCRGPGCRVMTKTYGSFTLIRVISASIRETGWATEIHSACSL